MFKSNCGICQAYMNAVKGNNAEVVKKPDFITAGCMVKSYATVIRELMERCLKNISTART